MNDNLPPGVGVNDISGNRPEDAEADAFVEALDERFERDYPNYAKLLKQLYDGPMPEGNFIYEEAVLGYAFAARDLAYAKGYEDGRRDAYIEEAAK